MTRIVRQLSPAVPLGYPLAGRTPCHRGALGVAACGSLPHENLCIEFQQGVAAQGSAGGLPRVAPYPGILLSLARICAAYYGTIFKEREFNRWRNLPLWSATRAGLAEPGLCIIRARGERSEIRRSA